MNCKKNLKNNPMYTNAVFFFLKLCDLVNSRVICRDHLEGPKLYSTSKTLDQRNLWMYKHYKPMGVWKWLFNKEMHAKHNKVFLSWTKSKTCYSSIGSLHISLSKLNCSLTILKLELGCIVNTAFLFHMLINPGATD